MSDFFSQARQRESVNASEASFRELPARLTFCVVTAVDIPNRSVTIKHAGSSLEESNIAYTSSSANSRAGQDNIPSKGDVAVVATTSGGTKVILGFIGGSNRSAEIALKEGDMLSKSLGDSIVKQDVDGNVFVSTKDGSHMLLTKDGDLKIHVSSFLFESNFIKMAEFEFDDVLIQEKKVFERIPSSVDEPPAALEMLIADEEFDIIERIPIVVENVGGKVVKDEYGDDVLESLDVGYIPWGTVVKSTEVLDTDTGDVLFSEKIDDDGNAKLSGRKIVIENNNPEEGITRAVFSNSVTNIVSMTQAAYDALSPKQDNILYVITE